ncbi:ABC transporter permease [Mesorhizobium sp. NZP2298]|uniref:ABC transporter permease n=1 Tax=Mesorhizobium sp. NZP2298 TaxID=2483403 RepID=UPI00155799FF|nr:ABC transporter permease [Mesorhizobium sp. NZP2298]QKC93764.1 ABC transporter permease [Mesorhizobium sp. NZP2298]
MTTVSPANPARVKRWQINRVAGLFLFFVAQIAITSALSPGYFSIDGMLDVTRQFSESGIVALGLTLVIITGGIDISVGALLSLVSVTIGFSYQAGFPLWAAIASGIAVGTLGGLFNGVLVTALRLHPLVVTLGTFALFRGIAFAVSDARAVSSFPSWFAMFGQSWIAGIVPVQLIVFIVLICAVGIVLARSTFGRYVYAVGNNELAARFSGVNVSAVKIAVYTLTGFLVGIAGLIQTSRLSTARGNAGYGLELIVIAMVVLGGTRITGGSGTIAGTVMGVLILSYLQDGLVFAGIRGDAGLIVIGLCLVTGVFLNEFFRKDRV